MTVQVPSQINVSETMSSSQLTELLNGQGNNYRKSRINEKIREMFSEEIASTEIVPAYDDQGRVSEYYLNELQSTMFVGRWHTPFLRQLSEYWIARKQPQQPMSELAMIAALATHAEQQRIQILEIQNQTAQVQDTVTQIQHRMDSRATEVGYKLLTDAMAENGITISKDTARIVIAIKEVPNYLQWITVNGFRSQTLAVHEEQFVNAVIEFLAEATQVTAKMWEHPEMGSRRFKV